MWTKDIFGVEKPIIGMLHLLPLPGDPGYDKEGGIEKIIIRARRELDGLKHGGVDGVLISNEFSLPYEKSVGTQAVASMARLMMNKQNFGFLLIGFLISAYLKVPTLGVALLGVAIATILLFTEDSLIKGDGRGIDDNEF